MGFFADLWKTKDNTHKVIGCIADAECKPIPFEGIELIMREIAFFSCINLIANRIGLCRMRQFEGRKEIQGEESWMWNVEPNKSQNASAFWHKFISKMYKDGEALIIEEPYGSGVVVADSFTVDDSKPSIVYRNVVAGARTIDRLSEHKVMYLRLNNRKIAPLITKMQDNFLRLLAIAQNDYQFNGGQHWKVHLNQTMTADDEWLKNFNAIIDKQVKPWLSGSSGVLPEFEGYDYKLIGGDGKASSQEYRDLYKTIWTETAKAFLIPGVLIDGSIADTSKATARLLTDVIDPIAQQITQEANRKRYGFDEYSRGNYLLFDTSTISHYDLLENAASVEKLVGSGLWSVNEIREKLGDTPIDEDWASKHYLTKNIGTTDDANSGKD